MPDFLATEKRSPRYRARQHWIMLLLRKPAKFWVIVLAVLFVLGLIWRWPMGLVFIVVAALLGTLRWRLWHSEQIWLTNKRIIHTQGVLETSRTEAWLRLERVSGMRVTESLLGAWLGYATIHVDAPGDHPGTHNLYRIGKALPFYDRFRTLVVEGHRHHRDVDVDVDIDDEGYGPSRRYGDYVTEELPDPTGGDRGDRGYRYRRY